MLPPKLDDHAHSSSDSIAREPRVRVPENAERAISDKRLVDGKLK